ncbi:hypothetical protein [Nocardioides jensenii]|uniref:hypothetical protein n=1 Tax=Nocardioides jensenii TaxID=1843 RepID=UPI000832E1DA|nr:hypothetical protein [Nocardioides jensenii]
MPLSSRSVSRRTTLAAAPLLLLASCRWGPADDSGSEREAKPTGSASAKPSDDDQVTAARDAIRRVEVFVSTTSNTHGRLSTPLAALTALHGAHLELLEDHSDPDEPTPRTQVPARTGAALVAVRREEQSLQRTLTQLAGEVSSGTLARTLAAMAAGVAQQIAVLPTNPKGDGA